MPVFEEDFLTLRDGTQIYLKVKNTGKDKWLIASHGIGEHLERHSYLVDLFSATHNILQYDLRGHGKSSGKRCYVKSFDYYFKDLKEVLSFARDKFGIDQYSLFGHSMGSLITAGFMQSYVDEDFYPEKVFINAPPIGFDGLFGLVMKYLPLSFLSKIPFGFKIYGAVNLGQLSHDESVRENYLLDDLNSKGIHTRTLFCLGSASKKVFSMPLKLKCNVFCTIGSSDLVVSYEKATQYFAGIESETKFVVFDGAYHEIHNEVDQYRGKYLDYLRSTLER